ncbi:MAG: Rieske (2Fe-2S) protein [Betaproteobacteria bacterium]|nr:Rieske (2Fe-2S) protein [Betaproteobacteria bacterium]
MSTFFAALPASEVSATQPRRCKVDGVDVLLVRDALGKIFAFENNCSHADKPLDRGVWNPQTREMLCPFHKAVFDVGQGGLVKVGPAVVGLQVFAVDVRLHDGEEFVFVEMDDSN